MDKISQIISSIKKYLLILLVILLAGLVFFIYKLTTYTYINIKFKDLRPIHGTLPVYYKGLLVGQSWHMEHCDNYKATLIKIVLFSNKFMLPKNTTALLKKERRHKESDFIELIYPQKPSSIMLSDGATIKGKATVDVAVYMANADPDELDQIRQDLADSARNLKYASKSANELMNNLNSMVNENRKNLFNTTNNLSSSTQNLSRMSSKVNNSLNQQQLNDTMSNLSTSLSNIKTTTETLQIISTDVNGVTKGISVTTMPGVNSSIDQMSSILKNLDQITTGVANTMKKRFAGLRLLFGTPIDPCEDQCQCPQR